jgi:hypothetical protein
MSGGVFDYAYMYVSRFADELELKIENRKTANEWGETYYDYSDEVINKLNEILKDARRISSLMKEVEWLYSGDTGEDTFLERVNRIEKNGF